MNISNFVAEIIRNNCKNTAEGYELSIKNVDPIDKAEFAIQLIEMDGRDLTCINENNNHDDIMAALYTMLKNDDIDSKLAFADKIKDSVYGYYNKIMQEMIDDEIGYVESEDVAARGLRKITCEENGELRWV